MGVVTISSKACKLFATTIFLLFLSNSSALSQGRRLAFVWGVDQYSSIRSLQNAESDARAIASALLSQGFKLASPSGTDRASFWRAWDKFLEKVGAEDTVVYYFAGHGVQINQENYLLPSDAPDESAGEHELKSRSISLSELFKSLDDLYDRRPRNRIFILDACRENPYNANARGSFSSGGLAKTPVTQGTFVMYSADANQVALDRLSKSDPNPNSLYTRHLAPLLSRPGLRLNDIAKQVQDRVFYAAQKVNKQQTPAYYDSIVGYFCLSGCDFDVASVASGTETLAHIIDDVSTAYFPQADRYALLISAADAIIRKFRLPSLPNSSVEKFEALRSLNTDENFYAALREFEGLIQKAVQGERSTSIRDVVLTAVYAAYGGLDNDSLFYDPERYGPIAMEKPAAIGIEFSQDFGRLRVTRLVKDGPADQAGLKVGDMITHIDGVSVAGLSEADLVSMLRGLKDTLLALTIVRAGTTGSSQVEVKRSTEAPSDVESREFVHYDALYLRVRRLTSATSSQARAIALKSSSPTPRNLIIDLRGCEGGELDATGAFIRYLTSSKKIAVGIKGKRDEVHDFVGGSIGIANFKSMGIKGKRDEVHDFVGGSIGIANFKSINILIDSETRGAAELVAAVLKEASDAKLWGSKTHGKGTVQRTFNYGRYGSSKLTTGILVINGDKTFDRIGVAPDVDVSGRDQMDVLHAVLKAL